LGKGMTTVVCRVREDSLFHVKLVVLSHNTIRGAAGGSLLNAELLVAQGLVK
jgi:aspartate-semialdehyde dehydrogenase